jgi:DNA modification methylase
MAKTFIINSDSLLIKKSADLILTDPPYDLSSIKLNRIISNFNANHLVLITTLSQLINFVKYSDYEFCFDFVIDGVVPKISRSKFVPNYVHQTCAYFKKKGEKSAFNRKLRERSDVFEGNGYWPTIIRAERNNMKEFGYAKNINAIIDILGSFAVKSVIDPFAGSFTTAIAANELNIDSISIEKNKETFNKHKLTLDFLRIEYFV